MTFTSAPSTPLQTQSCCEFGNCLISIIVEFVSFECSICRTSKGPIFITHSKPLYSMAVIQELVDVHNVGEQRSTMTLQKTALLSRNPNCTNSREGSKYVCCIAFHGVWSVADCINHIGCTRICRSKSSNSSISIRWYETT